MYLIIDRFEGEFAIVEAEDGSMYDIPKKILADACEGDALKIEVDKSYTKDIKDEIKALEDDLFI